MSEIQTSPTESLVQGNSRSWVVRSGQHEDQPWPKTKNGYSTKTSTLTWRRGNGGKTHQHNDTSIQNLVCKLLLSGNLVSNPQLFSRTLNSYDYITVTIHQLSSHSDSNIAKSFLFCCPLLGSESVRGVCHVTELESN